MQYYHCITNVLKSQGSLPPHSAVLAPASAESPFLLWWVPATTGLTAPKLSFSRKIKIRNHPRHENKILHFNLIVSLWDLCPLPDQYQSPGESCALMSFLTIKVKWILESQLQGALQKEIYLRLAQTMFKKKKTPPKNVFCMFRIVNHTYFTLV